MNLSHVLPGEPPSLFGHPPFKSTHPNSVTSARAADNGMLIRQWRHLFCGRLILNNNAGLCESPISAYTQGTVMSNISRLKNCIAQKFAPGQITVSENLNGQMGWVLNKNCVYPISPQIRALHSDTCCCCYDNNNNIIPLNCIDTLQLHTGQIHF